MNISREEILHERQAYELEFIDPKYNGMLIASIQEEHDQVESNLSHSFIPGSWIREQTIKKLALEGIMDNIGIGY